MHQLNNFLLDAKTVNFG